MEIRQARPWDAAKLTHIAMRSKAYWGYDDDFMESCRAVLTITADKIINHKVLTAVENGVIAGFCCLIADGETGILDDMFIDPGYIGKGCGRLLWVSMMRLAAEQGIREVTIDADPNAERFYLKMGAVRIGEVESTVKPGRKLPFMKAPVQILT